MKSKPIIHVYAVCRNEAEILPFFLDHYTPISQKIVIYDNQSEDKSKEIMSMYENCIRIDYNTRGVLRDDIHMMIKNSCWKESKGLADWVIVSDLDEFLYHRNLLGLLKEYSKRGVTVPATMGFNMVSDQYPQPGKKITAQIRFGSYSKRFSKFLIFNPNEIEEIDYKPGGHEIRPEGNVKYSDKIVLKVLHFKYMGGIQRLQERWDEVGRTLSEINIKNKWGYNRAYPEEIRKRYYYVRQHSELVVDTSLFELRSKFLSIFKKRDNDPYI